MEKIRTCGECSAFFECLSESSEMLQRVAPGEEVRALKQAPACSDFCEIVPPDSPGYALVSKIRDLAHEAQHRGEESEIIVAALELCEEYSALERILESAGKTLDDVRAMLEAI